MFVSAQLGGVCDGAYPLTGKIRGYTNPFEKATGLVWERTDQGVDARMNAGSPLLAFAPSKVELIVGDFYAGEPAIVFEITAGPLAGKWWYWSEQIQPTVSQGQTVAAGQDGRDVRAGGHRDRDRLVDAERRLPARAPWLRGRARDQRGRRFPLPTAGAGRQPRVWCRPVQRPDDGQQLLPDRQPRAVIVLAIMLLAVVIALTAHEKLEQLVAGGKRSLHTPTGRCA